MNLGMVGLGKMGLNMSRRLLRGGHHVVGSDPAPAPLDALVAEGGAGSTSLADMVAKLPSPKVVWIMVPAGKITEQVMAEISSQMSKGDVVIDGGNSNFKDSMRHAGELAAKGIEFVDAGTSGGIWGLDNGYCLMVGGTKGAIDTIAPILTTLAPPEGWLHTGAAGSGHYTKMIHNGIEYGMMQAYAEGFEILHASPFSIDLAKVSSLWMKGSVVRSWLLELAADAFEKNGNDLEAIKGYVEDSGEGRWTVFEAIDHNVPAPVITASLFARFASRQPESFAAKVNAALRNEFGGHAVKKS